MRANLGTVDKALRNAIAVILALLVFVGMVDGIAAVIVAVIAVVLGLTALLQFCPLYRVLGFSTCKAGAEDGSTATEEKQPAAGSDASPGNNVSEK